MNNTNERSGAAMVLPHMPAGPSPMHRAIIVASAKEQEPLADVLKKAGKRALGGGMAGKLPSLLGFRPDACRRMGVVSSSRQCSSSVACSARVDHSRGLVQRPITLILAFPQVPAQWSFRSPRSCGCGATPRPSQLHTKPFSPDVPTCALLLSVWTPNQRKCTLAVHETQLAKGTLVRYQPGFG